MSSVGNRQRCNRVTGEKSAPAGTKARMYGGMISVFPNANGGMRFAFPPYGTTGLILFIGGTEVSPVRVQAKACGYQMLLPSIL
jgi:hypothetical protein